MLTFNLISASADLYQLEWAISCASDILVSLDFTISSNVVVGVEETVPLGEVLLHVQQGLPCLFKSES